MHSRAAEGKRADAKPKPVRKALGKLDANAKGGCASVEVTLHKESEANKGGKRKLLDSKGLHRGVFA